MSKEKKHALSGAEGLIPELRFPDFVNDGEWEDGELGDHCEITTGKLDANAMVANGQYRFYTCAKDYYYIDNYAFDTDALLISGNGAHVGYIHHYNGKFNAYQRTYVLDNFDKDIHYVQYFLERNLKARIASEKKDGNTPYIVRSTLTEMQHLYPKNEDEQQKIASCLSSLDELIAAHKDKLEALKDHKKGLLQNLFPQEGETVPKVRFPEFEDDGDWVEKTFEELFTIGSGKDYKHLSEGEIPVYGSGGYMLSVDDFLHDGESVCIGRKGTIDNPIFLTGKFWTVDTLFYTYQFVDCLPKFIYYIFLGINWQNHNEAGGVPSLSKKNLYQITTAVPTTIEEQKKIASCLSAVDALITAQQEKIDELQQHKKGLMQGLFPKIAD